MKYLNEDPGHWTKIRPIVPSFRVYFWESDDLLCDLHH